jgi:hypothetical protein
MKSFTLIVTWTIFFCHHSQACISLPTIFKVSGSSFEKNNKIKVMNSHGKATVQFDSDEIFYDSFSACWKMKLHTANENSSCMKAGDKISLMDDVDKKVSGKFYIDPINTGKITVYSIKSNGVDRDFEKPVLVIQAKSKVDRDMKCYKETNKCEPIVNSVQTDLEMRGEQKGNTIGIYNSTSSSKDLSFRSLSSGVFNEYDLNGKRYIGGGGCGGNVKQEPYSSDVNSSASRDMNASSVYTKSLPSAN